jgi:rRNA-processing protein FCF1
MVETGDIYYSSCRLTDIGKEYAKKGKKFKTTENKKFELYFDNISSNHKEAKELFSKFNIQPKSLIESDDYLNDTIIKEIAQVQQPDIYSPEKGNSFTNAKINSHKSYSYELLIYAAYYYNLETKQFRFIAYEPSTKKEIEYISQWLSENHKDQLIKHYFKKTNIPSHTIKIPKEYSTDLIELKNEFEKELVNDPEKAISIVKQASEKTEYIEAPYFWKNMISFIESEVTSVYLFIPAPTVDLLEIITLFTSAKIVAPIFLIIKQSKDKEEQQLISSLHASCLKTKKYLFLLETEQLKNFAIWTKVKEKTTQFENISLILEHENEKIVLNVLGKSELEKTKCEPICSKVLSLLAEEYLPRIYQNALAYIEKEKELKENKLNYELVNSYSEIGEKAFIFQTLNLSQEQKTILNEIKKGREALINFQNGRLKLAILNSLEVIKNDYDLKDINELNEIVKYIDSVKAILDSTPNHYVEVINYIQDFIKIIKEREKYIKDEILAKTYIIDTNIFIDEPNILEFIDKKNYVALNFMVIEELDKLKIKEKTKEKAAAAIRNINTFLQNSLKEKYPRVRKAKANLRILPEELQNKSGDNYILAVAYGFIEKNPVIISNDNNIQVKAQMLDIPVLNLAEYKKNINLLNK